MFRGYLRCGACELENFIKKKIFYLLMDRKKNFEYGNCQIISSSENIETVVFEFFSMWQSFRFNDNEEERKKNEPCHQLYIWFIVMLMFRFSFFYFFPSDSERRRWAKVFPFSPNFRFFFFRFFFFVFQFNWFVGHVYEFVTGTSGRTFEIWPKKNIFFFHFW